jgi:hypothetical protein
VGWLHSNCSQESAQSTWLLVVIIANDLLCLLVYIHIIYIYTSTSRWAC